jgi:hypothetical protein
MSIYLFLLISFELPQKGRATPTVAMRHPGTVLQVLDFPRSDSEAAALATLLPVTIDVTKRQLSLANLRRFVAS